MSFPNCCLFAMISFPVHAHSPKICLDGLICADQVLTPNGVLTTVFSITGIKSRNFFLFSGAPKTVFYHSLNFG